MRSVMVTGSRTWSRPQTVWDVLDGVHQDQEITVLIHGGAVGADIAAKYWAESRGVTDDCHRPDYVRYHPKSAPHIRNEEMLNLRPDLLVAFWDGRSSGTKSVIRKARKLDIPILQVM